MSGGYILEKSKDRETQASWSAPKMKRRPVDFFIRNIRRNRDRDVQTSREKQCIMEKRRRRPRVGGREKERNKQTKGARALVGVTGHVQKARRVYPDGCASEMGCGFLGGSRQLMRPSVYCASLSLSRRSAFFKCRASRDRDRDPSRAANGAENGAGESRLPAFFWKHRPGR